MQPEILEADLGAYRESEQTGKKGMRGGGGSTQAQMISMGTNKHLQNMTAPRSTRPLGQNAASKPPPLVEFPLSRKRRRFSSSANKRRHVNIYVHTETTTVLYFVNV